MSNSKKHYTQVTHHDSVLANVQTEGLSATISKLCSSMIVLYLFAIGLASLNNVQAQQTIVAEASTEFEIQILSHEGKPLSEMVIEVEYDDSNAHIPERADHDESTSAIMEQIEQQFVPHILIVQQGDTVMFPNSDNVKHHVYSFSSSKTFEQQLYKGKEADPVAFEQAGIVELGCNIHDWMLGYIYVSKSDHVALSDANGKARFANSNAIKTVHVWHPSMREPQMRISKTIDSKDGQQIVQIKLSQAMQESLSDYDSINIHAY